MAKTYIKAKSGPALGYRTPDAFKMGNRFKGRPQLKFNPNRFHTQHKGGS